MEAGPPLYPLASINPNDPIFICLAQINNIPPPTPPLPPGIPFALGSPSPPAAPAVMNLSSILIFIKLGNKENFSMLFTTVDIPPKV